MLLAWSLVALLLLLALLFDRADDCSGRIYVNGVANVLAGIADLAPPVLVAASVVGALVVRPRQGATLIAAFAALPVWFVVALATTFSLCFTF
jgi:hypothetical protein